MAPGKHWSRVLLLFCFFHLALTCVALSVGPTAVEFNDCLTTFVRYSDDNVSHFAIWHLRLPRALVASLIGGSLAVSGVIMQGLTRNPLAGPTMMGLSPGASLVMLIGLIGLPNLSMNTSILLSFLGAFGGYLTVCFVAYATPGGFTPTKLALAGSVVSAVVTGFTHVTTVLFSLHDEMLYWTVGGIANVSWVQVWQILPFSLCGLVLALLISTGLTSLSIGKEASIGIGNRVTQIRILGSLAVLLLTSSVVAVAGPVAFVGLMIPHIAKGLVGARYTQLILLSMVLGASLTLLSDMISRILTAGEEVPLGLMTTLVGAPFLVYLVLARPITLEARP